MVELEESDTQRSVWEVRLFEGADKVGYSELERWTRRTPRCRKWVEVGTTPRKVPRQVLSEAARLLELEARSLQRRAAEVSP